MTPLAVMAAKLSYKPGWHFWIEEDGRRPRLVLKASVLHSQTLEPVSFEVRRLVPAIAQGSTRAFVSWAKDITEEAEIHELREFFRYDGSGGIMTPAGRGAALLDEHNPGWREKLQRLIYFPDSFDCPLGQLYGSYGAGVRALRPLLDNSTDLANWTLAYGFDAYYPVTPDCNCVQAWQALTAEWRRLAGQDDS
jgi:hypothetical protein